MTGVRTRRRWSAHAALALALLLGAAGCAHRSPFAKPVVKRPGTPADSVTLALYRMDEIGGLVVADAGRSRLDGRAGPDTRTIFGRFRNARLFSWSANSFVYVPYSPLLDVSGPFSIETWIAPNAYSRSEDTVIAARWSPTTAEHSWILAIVGLKVDLTSSAGWHWDFVNHGSTGQLMFVYQPDVAAPPRVFFSTQPVELQRWTHVAVTFDGEVVSFWFDGSPQGTFATSGNIRASSAPLLLGNFFDSRLLTEFGGDLRQGSSSDGSYSYALDGGLDELRISNVARTRFPLSGGD
jgi:hypothetical protein